MLAVAVANLVTISLLVGLLAGIAAGFIAARTTIADALRFDIYAGATNSTPARATARALPA